MADVSEAPTDEPRRRGRPRDASIDRRIIEATLALLATDGAPACTVDAVARRADVPKSTIYRRWRTKDELQAAALARLADDSEVPDTGTLRGDILVLLRAQMEQISTPLGRSIVRFAFATVAGGAEETASGRALREIARTRRRRYRAVLERAVARGEVDPAVDLEAAVDLVFGAVWSRLFGLRTFADDYAPTLADLAARALAPRSAGIDQHARVEHAGGIER